MAGAKILIVDDDSDARSMVKTILTGAGYEITEAEGGAKALSLMEENSFELVILDIMMPEMSGYDVVVHMKQRPETQNLPIMMLSAKGDPEDLILGYKDYGVEYYIPKPFTTRQIVAGVKLILGGDSAEVE